MLHLFQVLLLEQLVIYTDYSLDMDSFRMRFIVGKLTEEELLTLKSGGTILSKMLLIPDDYKLFRYQEGDKIEAETEDGNRIWTTIRNIEVIEDEQRVIVILTLSHTPAKKRKQ
jgi:hypothetical protein